MLQEGTYTVTAIRGPESIGGQQVGMPKQDIEVIHTETGISARCGFMRQQHKNRTIAMEMVEYALSEVTR